MAYDANGVYILTGKERKEEGISLAPCGTIVTTSYYLGDNPKPVRVDKKVFVKETALGRLRGQAGKLSGTLDTTET